MGLSCGFYPGTEPREFRQGSPRAFEVARTDFEHAWPELSASRTEADFETWRHHRDVEVWKQRMHEQARPLQQAAGAARCFCGETITIASVDAHVAAARWRSRDEVAVF